LKKLSENTMNLFSQEIQEGLNLNILGERKQGLDDKNRLDNLFQCELFY